MINMYVFVYAIKSTNTFVVLMSVSSFNKCITRITCSASSCSKTELFAMLIIFRAVTFGEMSN